MCNLSNILVIGSFSFRKIQSSNKAVSTVVLLYNLASKKVDFKAFSACLVK